MRICMIFSTPYPPREGIGNYIYNMSKKFIERGDDVTMITRGGLNTRKELFESTNVFKTVFVPCYPLHVHFHKIFVNKLFKRLEPTFDIVHIHSPLAPIVSTKLPILSTFHTPVKISVSNFEHTGIFSHLSNAQWRVSYTLENDLLARSDMVTAVSNTVARQLEDEYDVEKGRVKVVYNGVDEKIFVPSCEKREDNYILYVGGLTYRKGLFDLIECGKYIVDKYKDIKFVIVGDGILRKELQRKLRYLGIDKRFEFKGYVSKTELVKLYQNAMMHVVPSHYEGLPTVLLEAMSCGLPVVATSISGNIDVVRNGENGILIPSKSPKDMAIAISTLLEDNTLRKCLGKMARKTIEEKFTWNIISTRISNYYKEMYES